MSPVAENGVLPGGHEHGGRRQDQDSDGAPVPRYRGVCSGRPGLCIGDRRELKEQPRILFLPGVPGRRDRVELRRQPGILVHAGRFGRASGRGRAGQLA